jgi:hypothetical protein
MTARRRVRKIEDSLSTAECVLLWVAEAQRYETLDDYVETLREPGSITPLDAILARIDARFDTHPPARDETEASTAKRRAARNAAFLYQLVLTLNQATGDAVAQLGPFLAALIFEVGTLMRSPLSTDIAVRRLMRLEAAKVDRSWRFWRAAASGVLVEVRTAADAMASVQATRFAGHSVLFPRLEAEWAQVLKLADALRAVNEAVPRAVRRRSTGAQPDAERAPIPSSARLQTRVEGLLDDAQRWALYLLADHDRAVAVHARGPGH